MMLNDKNTINKNEITMISAEELTALNRAGYEIDNPTPKQQFVIASDYFCGDNLPQNYEQAQYWFQLAANRDHAEAQAYLGEMYVFGYANTQSDELAFHWLLKSAAQECEEGMHNIGSLFYNSKVKSDGLLLAKNAGEQAYIHALMGTAEKYYYGNNVDIDKQKAASWLKKAAEQNHLPAQLKLIEIFRNNNDTCNEFKWLKEAAKHNDLDSQEFLAYAYMNGVLIEKDHEQAVFWLRKASDNGSAHAMFLLGKCFASGTGVKKDDLKAIELFLDAAFLENTDAMKALMKLTLNQASEPSHYIMAFAWLSVLGDLTGEKDALKDLYFVIKEHLTLDDFLEAIEVRDNILRELL